MYGPGKGLGAAACNFVDDFGDCITPGPNDQVVLAGSAYNRLLAAGGSNFNTFVNQNATTLGIGAAALLLFVMLSKR